MDKLNFKQLGFLLWLHKTYGNQVQATYKTLAKERGDLSYSSIRLLLIALANKGFIRLENPNTWRQTYYINVDKLREVLGNE